MSDEPTTDQKFRNLLDTPEFRSMLDALTPAVPILLNMALERAVQTIKMLANDDYREQGILALRRMATPEQWERYCEEVVSDAHYEALKIVEDRDFIIKLIYQLALIAVGAVL